jgi:hypothetical protein
MVYAVDGKYVYTIEGNSANMCRKRSYLLTDKYIYGWIRPNYRKIEESSSSTSTETTEEPIKIEQYGSIVFSNPELHLLSKGCAGPEVKTVQRILRGAEITDD